MAQSVQQDQFPNEFITEIYQSKIDCADELANLRSISDVQSNLQLQGKISAKLFGLMVTIRGYPEPEPVDNDADGFRRQMEVAELGLICIRTQKDLRVFFKKLDAFTNLNG
jgi:hypothetical protein